VASAAAPFFFALGVHCYGMEGPIQGVRVFALKALHDERGYFFESFRRTWLPSPRPMVQGNVSFSKAGVLRGLHYHLQQADFWLVPSGRVRVVLLDLRQASSTRGQTMLFEMGTDNPLGVYIPPGVAHGFYAITDSFMTYLVDAYYDGSDEHGVSWKDPAVIGLWRADGAIVSTRDEQNPPLAGIPLELLPP
jgi:dTDP-4-dehydrorhamnose 3,5-epimerase